MALRDTQTWVSFLLLCVQRIRLSTELPEHGPVLKAKTVILLQGNLFMGKKRKAAVDSQMEVTKQKSTVPVKKEETSGMYT